LEETLKKTKFIKRVLTFFMPSKELFVNMEWAPKNFIYAQTGYHLIRTLLSSKDGKKQLRNSPGVFFMLGFSFVEKTDNIFPQSKSFLQEMCDLLEREVIFLRKQRQAGQREAHQQHKMQNKHFQRTQMNTDDDGVIDPVEGSVDQHDKPYLSKKRLSQTMLREYLSWLGLFTTSKDGISLLRDFKITEHLQALIDSNGQYDHFCQIVLQSFDYGFQGPTRDLLESWLFKSSPNLAKSITEVFRMLFRSGLNDFSQWCM